jgi:hypothetical protein
MFYNSFLVYDAKRLQHMSDKPDDDPEKSSEYVVRRNEKFNVPIQTEKEEAETFEDAEVEHFAKEAEIQRKKEGID